MGIGCPSADGQSELKISEANAGAKPAKCTSASQPMSLRACVRRCHLFLLNIFRIYYNFIRS